ncbi:MAG: hypothetical protein WCP55_17395 [Lentisphaerota bacterium]
MTNKFYYIDWSAILPDKFFKLTFTFISETNIIQSLLSIPIITIDFLNQGNIDICQPTYQATSSNILGLIFPTYLDPNAHLAYFRSDKNFNNPIYLSRPRQNYFNVQINDNNKPATLWTDDAVIPLSMSPYILILSFEECE